MRKWIKNKHYSGMVMTGLFHLFVDTHVIKGQLTTGLMHDIVKNI